LTFGSERQIVLEITLAGFIGSGRKVQGLWNISFGLVKLGKVIECLSDSGMISHGLFENAQGTLEQRFRFGKIRLIVIEVEPAEVNQRRCDIGMIRTQCLFADSQCAPVELLRLREVSFLLV
jgi:hypothetical protein